MVSGSKGRIDEQVTKGTFYWTALSVRAVLLKLQCLRTTYLGIRFGFIQSGWGTERLSLTRIPSSTNVWGTHYVPRTIGDTGDSNHTVKMPAQSLHATGERNNHKTNR